MRLAPELLAKIRAHPKDLEVRLECARWLEQHGAARRAELIRGEVALRTRLDPAKRRELQDRLHVLRKVYDAEWMAEVPELTAADLRYRCGFIEELELDEQRLARDGEAILASEPVFRLWLKMKDGKGLAKAASRPWFEQIRWMKVVNGGDQAAMALASATHATNLENLLLAKATGEGVSALARSKALPALRTLGLTGSDGFEDDGVEALAEGQLVLERLFLSRTTITSDSVSQLAEAKRFQSLKVLALNGDELGDEDAETLAGSKVLVNLERLELAQNDLSLEGALVFRSAKALPRLKHLDLRGMWYDTRELEPLRRRLGRGLKF